MAVGDNLTRVLFDNVTDPDGDNFTFILGNNFNFILDNQSAKGATLILNDNVTGNFTYIANAGAGPDNFSYRAIDNYSVASHPALVSLQVVQIAPAPAYNVDNFSARVDNGSTITTSWNLFPDNGSQAPEGFLLLCSSADNISASLPQDRTTLGHGMSYDACGDGFGYVYLDNHTHNPHGGHAMPTQFTWDNLTLHQQYFFGIYSLTNNFNNFKYVNYFDGVGATSDNTTNTAPFAGNLSKTFGKNSGDNSTADNITLPASDADGDSLIFTVLKFPDNGTLAMLDNQTGMVRYTPADNFTGPDNFTFRVTDNYSAVSNVGMIFIEVTEGGLAPEPAYNVDNFTVTVDNSSTITTTWDLFTGLGGQAPEGFLLLCSGSDNLTVPTDNISYAEDNQCADGSGAVNLDNSSTQFTWFGLADNQTYYFSIHSFTNSGSNINYFTGGNLQSDNGTTPAASGGGFGGNRVPVAEPGTSFTLYNTTDNITLKGSDPDNDSLTFEIVDNTSHGTLTLLNNQTGETEYVPTGNFSGFDNFTFRVLDNNSQLSENATFQIHVSDPLVPHQWQIINSGQTAFSANPGTAGEDMNMNQALEDHLTGKGIKVAIVDEGFEIAHEDLVSNAEPNGSWDFVGNDNDPTKAANDGDHGTSVGGLVGAVSGNGKGGQGAAPGTILVGYNYLLSQDTNNFLEAHGRDEDNDTTKSTTVDIFNMSYGGASRPNSTYQYYLEEQSFQLGVSNLRDGKGAIYVKSAGNGFSGYGGWACGSSINLGVTCENSNMDLFNTYPSVIVVGALAASGEKSSYSTAGSANWISAPGGEYGQANPAMITPDQEGCDRGYSKSGSGGNAFENNSNSMNPNCNYTSTFNGTSSAAPNTSAAVALMLEANDNLTWREVKHILATTAKKTHPSISPVSVSITSGDNYTAEQGWITNAAGYHYHNWYGFGAVNIDNATDIARTWNQDLGSYQTCNFQASSPNQTIPASASGLSDNITVNDNISIEAVQILVNATHPYPGDLGFELTSPSGTKSILLNIRNGYTSYASSGGGFDNLSLLSNAFYHENSLGEWSLKAVDGVNDVVLSDNASLDNGTLTSWYIRLYGSGTCN